MSPIVHSNTSRQILIIGAGIAGLAAADALAAHPEFEVTILEARDRIGGRIWTDHHRFTFPIDLGASWIHGIQNNPIFELIQNHPIHFVKTENVQLPDSFYASGKPLPEASKIQMYQDFRTLTETAYGLQETGAESPRSLEHVLNIHLRAMFKDEDKIRKRQVRHLIATEIENEYSTETAHLSFRDWDQIKEFSGDEVVLPEGYDQVPQLLEANLKMHAAHVHILLKSIVKEVNYKNQVEVTLTDGRHFTGERIIVTLPLGVLKEGSVQFNPELPARSRRAINKAGFGNFHKLYLEFPTQFWNPRSTWIEYVGRNPRQWPMFLNLTGVLHAPILAAFNVGDFARGLETKTETELVAEAMKVLRKIYGAGIPQPTRSFSTHWSQDPFTLGSYTYVPPGFDRRELDFLAEPIQNKLFFAGEATNSQYYGTVHGAFLSGQKAAQEIIKQVSAPRL